MLALLWVLTTFLLMLQAAAAIYTTARNRRTQALLRGKLRAPEIAVSPVALDVGPPDAVVLAGRAPDAASDARPDAVNKDAIHGTAIHAPARVVRVAPTHGSNRPPRPDAGPDPSRGPVVDDVRVPTKVAGDPGQGQQVFRMGCGLCHGRTTGAINPRAMSRRQWTRYFAGGLHGRHTPLRSNFTRTDLSHVKAYLLSLAGGGR